MKKKSKINIYNIVLFLLLIIIAFCALFYVLKTLGFLDFDTKKKSKTLLPTKTIKLDDDTLEEIEKHLKEYSEQYFNNSKSLQHATNDNLKTQIARIVTQLGGENINEDLTEYETELDKFIYKVGTPQYQKLMGLEELIGLKQEKEALSDLRTCMSYSIALKEFKQKLPNGVIFHGVPGTGKTTLERALAKTTNFHYMEIDGTNFQKYNTKEGIKMVNALFKKTSNMDRGIIVCIDECENTWGSLKKAENQSTKNIVTKFKNSFTSIENQNHQKQVFWIGTTNHLEDIDDAILSRFDYKIEVKPLDLEGRKKYFDHVLVKKLKNDNLISEGAIRYLIDQLAPEIEEFPELQTFRDMETFIRISIITAIKRYNQNPSTSKAIIKEDLQNVFNNKKQEIIDQRNWQAQNKTK
ncbi:AAA+ ATPase [Candidatus Phytoplasma mali]|uniref:AAA+ ATPase n=1 Tax=Phytoplasma mali (strain AT) TaxID=482235 RepID=B3R0G9_PHYMT|nr:ATP-binding protein [Candidatus Phytoplasma mali]CAP18333.1 AAA+ ATPase [Candidatus Phytoplasma mali]